MFISDKTFTMFGKFMKGGKKYIIPERGEEWDYLCFSSLRNAEIRHIFKNYIFKIVQTLSNNESSIEKLIEQLKVEINVLPDQEWETVLQEVVKYSPRGYEFATKSPRVIGEKTQVMLEELHTQNKNFTSQRPTTSNKK